MRHFVAIGEGFTGAPATHVDPTTIGKKSHTLVESLIHAGREWTAIDLEEAIVRIDPERQMFDVFVYINTTDAAVMSGIPHQ
jgi:hypothetical protein